jgi:hypothetical protein
LPFGEVVTVTGEMLAPLGGKLPEDTPQLRALCERLVPGEAPTPLDVDDPAPPWAKVNECFVNVERAIAEHGGGLQVGWALWEPMPRLMIEAELHGVWVDRAGGYRDVTPKAKGAKRILFLPDPVRTYDGRQVDNIRVSLVDDPLLTDYIRTWEQFYAVTNEGDLADYHGAWEDIWTPEMERLKRRREQLGLQIAAKYYGLGR